MNLATIPAKIGPYRIEARLGTGGMGTVYRAYDERLDRRVALKQIRPDRVQRKKARARFLREARIAARLNHPSLVHVHDILEEAGSKWIVMELVEGTLLSQLFDAGALPLRKALPLAIAIASGLSAAHAAGILHRDLKGENVIVTTAGGAKILDFGLAKPLDPDSSDLSMTTEGGILGTPRAMSPEQAQGHEVDERSDLFSFGILLYEMLTGQSPFRGPAPLGVMHRICQEPHEPVQDHGVGIPSALARLVDRLLAKHPADRPANAQEVLASLERISLFSKSALRLTGEETEVEPAPVRSGVSTFEPLVDTFPGFSRRGERRHLTVLCCELIGEGELSISLAPEDFYEALPAFQRMASQTIERHGGYLGDVQGHRLILYFGYPQSYEDNARRAVLTALEIVSKSARLIDRPGDSPRLTARAGINSGPAVVLATAGADERLALGSTLDLATSLQEQAAPGTVLVSELTHRLSEGLFVNSSEEPATTEDSGSAFQAYRVERPSGMQSRVEGAENLPPMVARDQEIAFLIDRFKLAQEGAGQVVLVSGGAGLGKSRLLRAFNRQLTTETIRRQDLWWLIGHGTPHERHVPLAPVAGLLNQILDFQPEASSEQQREAIIDVLREYEIPGTEVESALFALFGLSSSPGPLQSEARRRLINFVPELLLEIVDQRAEKQQTTVLVFESLQWLDPSTLEMIALLIDRCAASSLLLILTARSDFQSSWGHASHLGHLHLNPLTPDHAEALIKNLPAASKVIPKVRREIVERASGVPLYLEELTFETLLRGKPESGRETSIPPTLWVPLIAKLDRLGTAKDLAQSAAVLGQKFLSQDLCLLSSLDEDSFKHEIARLLESQVLGRDNASRMKLHFRHPMLREALLEMLLAEDRSRLEQHIRTSGVHSTPSHHGEPETED